MTQRDEQTIERRAARGDPAAQEELALRLLAASQPGSEPFRTALGWLDRAIAVGHPPALATKGHVHLQHPTLADAPAVARECFTRGARAGDPHAVERLADLFLLGYGVERDDAKAFSLYRQLAGYGFPSVLCQTAYLLSEGIGCEPDEGEAASLVLRAAAQGHTLAFFLAAHRYAAGLGVPADPAIAAAWMELASARAFPSAERTWQRWLDALDDLSRSRSRELAGRLKENLAALGAAVRALGLPEDHPDYPSRFEAALLENFRALAVPELDPDSPVRGMDVRRRPERAFRPEVCSWTPRVFRLPGFASPEECGYLLDLAQPVLRPTAEAQGAGRAVEVDAFDGECAMLPNHLATPVVRALLRRFALLLQVREQHFEPLSVLRYGVGDEYTPHVDYFDGERMERHRLAGDLGGQRITTALVYLIEAEEGGETHYPVSGTTVTGAPGTAVVHHNATPDGLADPDSRHHGRPILAGEKWLARTAVREASLYDRFERIL